LRRNSVVQSPLTHFGCIRKMISNSFGHWILDKFAFPTATCRLRDWPVNNFPVDSTRKLLTGLSRCVTLAKTNPHNKAKTKQTNCSDHLRVRENTSEGSFTWNMKHHLSGPGNVNAAVCDPFRNFSGGSHNFCSDSGNLGDCPEGFFNRPRPAAAPPGNTKASTASTTNKSANGATWGAWAWLGEKFFKGIGRKNAPGAGRSGGVQVGKSLRSERT
jgi:hypothetical protein